MLALILVGCQLPVDGSSANFNTEVANSRAVETNGYPIENEYQFISNVEPSFLFDEKIYEVDEVDEVDEVINILPFVLGESLSVNEDSSILLPDLLANDIDENGDLLSIYDFTQGSEGGIIERFDGNVLRYSPKLNFNGNEYFLYSVSDGNGERVEGKVNINVVPINDLPVARTDIFTLKQSQVEILNILENDDGVGDGVQISLISQAKGGVVSILNNGFVSYTPYVSYFGDDEFIYKITDQNGDFSTASVALNIECENKCMRTFMLGWEASQSMDVIGYNVYMGRSSDAFDTVFELGNGVEFAYLADKKGEYFFAVSAVNVEGMESELTRTVIGLFR